MLRIFVISVLAACLIGQTESRAWSGESQPPSDSQELRNAQPWSPVRSGGSAIMTLLELYSKHLTRNQPERYRLASHHRVPEPDKIKLLPINEDLSASGAEYLPRLPPSAVKEEDGITFSDDDRLKSRLPVDAPNRQSKISNGPLLNVSAMNRAHQRCVQSGLSSYCEETHDYPAETIRNLLLNDIAGLTKYFSPLELKPTVSQPLLKQPAHSPTGQGGLEIHTRVKPVASAPTEKSEDYSLCGAMRTEVFPKSAKSVDGDWVTIINQDSVRQAISMEKCNSSERPCRFAKNFPAGFKAVCKQKYMRHRLTVFKNNEIKQDTFLFPSCCVCEVRPVGLEEEEPPIFTNDDATDSIDGQPT